MVLLPLALFERAMQNWLTELFVASGRLHDFPLNVVVLDAIRKHKQTQIWPLGHRYIGQKASFRLYPFTLKGLGENVETN